jgi:hypothetical protein
MDKLKEYLLRHRADLDVDSPANDTWDKIGSKMSDETDQTRVAMERGFPARSGFSRWVVRVAAAACVVALAGTGLWLLFKDNKAPSGTAKYDSGTIKKEQAPGKERIEDSLRKVEDTPDKEIARNTSKSKQSPHKTKPSKPKESSDEVTVIDKSYSKLIDYQLKKLRATPLYAENGSYFSFYTEQFKEMDQDEQAVRNDIKTYGLNTEFLEQLINVYQQKLNLLKNLEAEINKMNNKVREKQTPSERPEVHYLNI